MQRHQLAHQRQPDAKPALRAVDRRWSLDEGFKHTLQKLRGQAGSRIVDADQRPARLFVHADPDFTALRRKLQRVGQQVVEDLLDPGAVAADPDRVRLNGDAVARRAVRRAQRVHTVVHTVGQIERLSLKHDLAGHQTAHIQQVVDDVAQMAVLPANDVQVSGSAHRVRAADLQ